MNDPTLTTDGAWLRAEGLDKTYRSAHRRVEVLRGVDLHVRAGESVAITGASGSGKSTLLNLLGSLDHFDAGSIAWGDTTDRALVATSGEGGRRWAWTIGTGLVALACAFGAAVLVLGQSPVDPVVVAVSLILTVACAVGARVLVPSRSEVERSRLRNRRIGFVFQQHHLMGDFTALENVLMPARVQGLPVAVAESRARNLLSRVGLEGRVDHLPGELSGGEQQRVAIARALMNEPRLLLLDEPGGNLDRQRADDLHELLLRLAREDGVAVVAVTHDESLARRADRWLHLVDGRLTEVPAGSRPALRSAPGEGNDA